MDKKKLANHIDEIENLKDMIQHYLSGLQLHLDKMKKVLNEPDSEPEMKQQPLSLPTPIPLEKQKDRYLTAKETSEITGISVGTLANHRTARKGIPFVKVGKSVRYKMTDILSIMDGHRINPEQLRARGRSGSR